MDNSGNQLLEESLSGDLPLFLVHRSYQHAWRTPEVLDDLAENYGTNLSLGTIIRLPKMTKNTAKSFSDSVSHVPVRLIDPEIWRHPDSGWPGESSERINDAKAEEWSYFSSVPQKPTYRWVKDILQVQRDYNASVMLSATGWVRSESGQESLQKAFTFVEASREQVGNQPMWVNLTLDYKWLTDEYLRNALIEEIIESEEQHWYLRFWWPEIQPRYGQLRNEHILEGYKMLTRECDLDDKKLYLPNTGLTGWLMTAMGAAGFSTGMSWKEQAFAQEPVIRRRPNMPAPSRIARLFDAKLLHTLEYEEYMRITKLEGHTSLTTPFLEELNRNGHSHELAGLHYLAAVGALTASLNEKRPNRKVERLIRDAKGFLEKLSPVDQLSKLSYPLHYSVWHSIVS